MKMCLTTTGNGKQEEDTISVLSNQLKDTTSKTRNTVNYISFDDKARSRNNPYDYSDYGNDISQSISHNVNYYLGRDLAQVKGDSSTIATITTSINDLHQAGTMARSIYKANQEGPVIDNIIINTEENNMRVLVEAHSATSSLSTEAISLPPSHISRTQSEMQLCQDIATAEWRDNCMFHRLVNGINEKQANRLQRRNVSNSSSNNTTTSATFLHISEQQQHNTDRRIELSLENIVRHHCEDSNHYASPFDDSYNTDSLLQHSYSTFDRYGEGNVIEPDEADSLVFDMDDI